MRVYRLCRASYPPYDGEGARRAGGRWNSKGVRVVYMSENRSLAILEILAHLSDVLPDKYVLGSADLPDDVSPEILNPEHPQFRRINFHDPVPFWLNIKVTEDVAGRGPITKADLTMRSAGSRSTSTPSPT